MKPSVVITQSNYVPWRGWFAMVRSADMLIFLDDVQFTRRDWRNRNVIANQGNKKWLTIPLASRGNYDAHICKMRVSDVKWWRSHISHLDAAYGSLEQYQSLRPQIHTALEYAGSLEFLTEINHHLCNWIFNLLQIDVAVHDSRWYPSNNIKSDRLIEICNKVSASEYISGPAAKNYLETQKFDEIGIKVKWVDYSLLAQKPSGLLSDDGFSILHDLAVFGVEETKRLTTFRSDTFH